VETFRAGVNGAIGDVIAGSPEAEWRDERKKRRISPANHDMENITVARMHLLPLHTMVFCRFNQIFQFAAHRAVECIAGAAEFAYARVSGLHRDLHLSFDAKYSRVGRNNLKYGLTRVANRFDRTHHTACHAHSSCLLFIVTDNPQLRMQVTEGVCKFFQLGRVMLKRLDNLCLKFARVHQFGNACHSSSKIG
jgi:hypothetical protein